jgi:hypothetical protein
MSEINFWNPCPETGRLVRTAKMSVPLFLFILFVDGKF